MAADSTMLRMVNLLIALSLGVHLEQLEQRMGLTWPRPFLLRPLLRPESQHPGSSPFISNPTLRRYRRLKNSWRGRTWKLSS